MSRPAARFQASAVPSSPAPPLFDAAPYLERIRATRMRVAVLRKRVREWFGMNPRREFYCVQLGRIFDCTPAEARRVLDDLEAEGYLASRHQSSPCSGNGRRYFRLRGAA